MNYHHNVVAQNDHMFSYQPIPFFEDMKQENRSFNKKLDLNLYCIKRPQQTCFIRMTNPNMLAWGIEEGDMLVVENNEELFLDELIVLEVNNEFHVYEFIAHNNGEFIFLSLDSKMENIKTTNWRELPIVGTVTNVIHQLQRKNTLGFAA
ncbi:LexA family transcriptional regulator [Aggregatibacter segnis]|uniref:ImpA protein n=1 Tax=Aggregatibacter segnis ATCC 33393 TaxID=888057 RepID=E6KX47_9PAST|nr:S24 family peptidase [Aggregatibacter segnis]EFU68078.1 ImpA protein [Aggregatibacter segnis ATCC 33393]QQB09542.1 LexA family transcriptional regulator [Aggregatibacter segnis]SQH64706.1 DNA polymerase V subunit UmuD [Aggregatibacter segnis ATCC 33393]